MSTKSRKKKIDRRAAKRWNKRMLAVYEKRAGSTPTLIFEDEYAVLERANPELVEEVRKEWKLK